MSVSQETVQSTTVQSAVLANDSVQYSCPYKIRTVAMHVAVCQETVATCHISNARKLTIEISFNCSWRVDCGWCGQTCGVMDVQMDVEVSMSVHVLNIFAGFSSLGFSGKTRIRIRRFMSCTVASFGCYADC